jgi:hypothetical protein
MATTRVVCLSHLHDKGRVVERGVRVEELDNEELEEQRERDERGGGGGVEVVVVVAALSGWW